MSDSRCVRGGCVALMAGLGMRDMREDVTLKPTKAVLIANRNRMRTEVSRLTPCKFTVKKKKKRVGLLWIMWIYAKLLVYYKS